MHRDDWIDVEFTVIRGPKRPSAPRRSRKAIRARLVAFLMAGYITAFWLADALWRLFYGPHG